MHNILHVEKVEHTHTTKTICKLTIISAFIYRRRQQKNLGQTNASRLLQSKSSAVLSQRNTNTVIRLSVSQPSQGWPSASSRARLNQRVPLCDPGPSEVLRRGVSASIRLPCLCTSAEQRSLYRAPPPGPRTKNPRWGPGVKQSETCGTHKYGRW